MAFYTGKAFNSELITTLVELLKTTPSGSSEPYWKEVQSGSFSSEGIILHSKGSSGMDNIYIQIKQGSNYYFNINVLDGYERNATESINGTFAGSIGDTMMQWNNGSYSTSYPIHYILSFDKDRIMLFLERDKSYTGAQNGTLLWAGLPERLSERDDSTAATMLTSNWSTHLSGYGTSNSYAGPVSRTRVLRSVNKSYGAINDITTMTLPSVGWGGKIILPDIYLRDLGYVRSRIHGVHPINLYSDESLIHRSEITVGSKRYTILNVFIDEGNYRHNTFPSNWIALEQLR